MEFRLSPQIYAYFKHLSAVRELSRIAPHARRGVGVQTLLQGR